MPLPNRRTCKRRRLVSTLAFIALLSAGVLLWLNQIGLPGFAKGWIQSRLREQGIELDFRSLRLCWDKGWQLEGLALEHHDASGNLSMSMRTARFRPNYSALFSGRFEPNSASLGGIGMEASWGEGKTNPPPLELNLPTGTLNILPGDGWHMTGVKGEVFGVKVELSGDISNAATLRDIRSIVSGKAPVKKPGPPATLATLDKRLQQLKNRLRSLANAARKTRFQTNLVLKASINGDGNKPREMEGELELATDGLRSPWGDLEALNFFLRLSGSATNAVPSRLSGKINLKGLSTQWGAVASLKGSFGSDPLGNNLLPAKLNGSLALEQATQGEVTISSVNCTANTTQNSAKAGHFRTTTTLISQGIVLPDGRADSVRVEIDWPHSLTNVVTDKVNWLLSLDGLHTSNAAVGAFTLGGKLITVNKIPSPPEDWAFWAKLAPFVTTFEGTAREISGDRNLKVRDLSFEGEWKAPKLALRNVRAGLYDGGVTGSALLDVDTRQAFTKGNFDFDLHNIIGLLTPKGQRWLSQYTWEDAPRVHGTAHVTLPEWTHRDPDWRKEVRPTLVLEGGFEVGKMSFRSIGIDSAHSQLSYSNQVWRLHNLVARRPEGEIRLTMESDTLTQDYHFQFNSGIDPLAIRPAFREEKQQQALNHFFFGQPPNVVGEIWGRWREQERTGFRASVLARNFSVRGQHYDEGRAGLAFTNSLLVATNAFASRPEGEATANGIGYDFKSKFIYLTNAVGRLDPVVVTSSIGPKTARALEPYQFLEPPHVEVNGYAQTGRGTNKLADLRFKVVGGAFRYWKFNAKKIAGNVHWKNQSVILTNIVTEFYGGELRGRLRADFPKPKEADLKFHLDLKDAQLEGLMFDLLEKETGLAGRLNTTLDITANSADWGSWNGTARSSLENGYLWDIPLFGQFSPLMNTLAPGLGSSRISAGKARFNIEKSLVKTDDLELNSPLMRLQYRGDVDFQGQVDARVEAEALRNTWVIGPIFSVALSPISKVLEYRVTGTLNQPEMELMPVPQFLLTPLRAPLQIIEGLIPGKGLVAPKKKPEKKTEPSKEREAERSREPDSSS